ncbi:hypothetical protein JCM10207_002740 [Rhodosporidiobolus poonsookiae]
MSGISPYHDAPGADITPPDGCKVSAAAFLIRHSSIAANDDEYEDYMGPFVEKVKAAQQNASLSLDPDSPLAFLKDWQSPIREEDIEQLTAPGRADAHSFGERFRTLYGPLLPPKDLGRKGKKGRKAGKKIKTPFKIWTASSTRDIDTAKAWIRGAFPHWQEGPDGEGDGKVVSLVKVPNKDPDWSVSLTPHKICDAFTKEAGKPEAQAWLETFGPPARNRMNEMAPGYNFELNDVIAAQMFCGYESVILKDRSSPFCSTDIFTEDEFKAHGYWHDLHWHYTMGYGAEVSPYLGVQWLNTSTHNLISAYERPHPHLLKDKKGDGLPTPSEPPNAAHTQLLFPYFTHREEPPLALVALGLWNTSNADLPTDRMPEDRQWKTAHTIPFLGHVALERLSCKGQDDHIRVLVNGAPQRLEGCQDGPGGSCEMGRFEEFVRQRTERYADFEVACKKKE